mmetsp:Transcript_14119/g.17116  ORF Transcript_14119/g.17116 Transcript_14119/m.17116 type:complete len:380 (+) Transcript_14119:94-1233(+)|eukprot:CAMPEP_0197851982 /NCGR_PEP_ID=MMETSP1438-20131217/19381_1 /TAXON_ID=1461541 /ORGANISM="Pterosperma sp., Strain CCMP1384" /LENGTH=379 /DNA_ID=CAMNT_0043465803 /DNA_START=62 /DNA_END=1201 /DNA_ORIENTATION=-
MASSKMLSSFVLALGVQSAFGMKVGDFNSQFADNGASLSIGLSPQVGDLHSSRKVPEGIVNDEERISSVNSGNHGWTAGHSTRFETSTLSDVSKLCGTVLKGEVHYHELPERDYGEFEGLELPAAFDSRDNWKSCTSIGHIRDQSSCGSCWAFGSTEAFEDRYCIATGKNKLFSTEDTTGCCGFLNCALSMGCNGGQPSGAWHWFTTTGVVTGGDYDDIGKDDTCKPYTLPPCAHHVKSDKYKACPTQEYHTPKCTKECSEKTYATGYTEDKAKAKKSFSVNGVENIMKEIMTNGPVTGAFSVYSDFPTYQSGVYTKTPGASMLGGHAIKIIGWGTEGGVDYWVVVNSWNETWGDGGTFKIKRGTDECGIESQISAGTF